MLPGFKNSPLVKDVARLLNGALNSGKTALSKFQLPSQGGGLVGHNPALAYPSDSVGAYINTLMSQVAALQSQASQNALQTGDILIKAVLSAQTGWLLIDGKTIGSATSGASARANADTLPLYTIMWGWSAAAVPIYTSAGAPSTRGASAAADFAANKRLALYTPDGGAFVRMWTPGQTIDPGRVAGVAANAVIANLPFSTTADDGDAQTGAGKAISRIQINGVGDDVFGQGAGEVRNFSAPIPASNDTTAPFNLPLPHYIKL